MPSSSPRPIKPSSETVYVRSPVVILPPSKPGAPSRRIAIQPTKVFALLLVVFLLGGSAATLSLWLVVKDVRQDNDVLASQMAELRQEVDALRITAPSAEDAAEAPTDTEGSPEGAEATDAAPLAIAVEDLRGPEPLVRIAVVLSPETTVLEGEGLRILHKNGRTTPMPGKAVLKPANNGVFARGIGNLRSGTVIETALGPIRIANQSYPGRMEIFREGKNLLLVNEIEMEDYVASVVSAELPESWGLETKKAQAVAARSYAFMMRATTNKAYHLNATVADQVYRGLPSDPSSRAAVTATRGQILVLDDQLVSAFYSSTCGGTTENPEAVWPGRPSLGLESVTCGYCTNSRSMDWSTTLTHDELLDVARKSGHRATEVTDFLQLKVNDSGRVGHVELKTDKGGFLWTGNEFRRALGWDRVRSSLFQVEAGQASYLLKGRGFGHGVGLCQWGAQGMERQGRDYRQILSHYYPSSRLEALY